MMKKRVIVVGGGAAGLTAAIAAARAGAAVTLLEHNEKPGKKICATGNGRCNLTNRSMPKDAYRGTDPTFVKEILRQFSVADTLQFFEGLGIPTVDREGFVYPRSGQAKAVADVLCLEAAARKVKIKTKEHVEAVFPEKQFWKVQTKTWIYEGDAVILANGSGASSVAGADGSGYEIAGKLGHTIIPPLPALTGLKCTGGSFSLWTGVRCTGAVTLFVDQTSCARAKGELQLTEYGISGIPVFQISTYAVRALAKGRQVSLTVDFLPEYEEDEVAALLRNRRQACPYKSDRELLIGLFPEKLSAFLLSRPALVPAIHALPLRVKSGMELAQAQVCSGGVATAEVNGHTLESGLHRGLYFAGELLDIDGTCGGYNLQWAWSSGMVAGRHAAKEIS